MKTQATDIGLTFVSPDPSVLTEYENQWIAVAPNGKEVVASDKSQKEFQRKLQSLKLDFEPLITWVLPKDVIYAPNSW